MRLPIFLALLFWCPLTYANDLTAKKLAITENPSQAATELLQQVQKNQSAELWYQLGFAYYQLSNKDAAIKSIDTALALAPEPVLEVQLLELKALVYGVLYRDTSTAVSTLKAAELALEQLNGAEKAQFQTSIYESFAQAYNQLGNMAEATRYAELSINIATEFQLLAPELQARLIAGRIALQQNNFALSQLQLSRALELAKQLNKEIPMASIHLRLGMAYRKIEQYQQSIDHLLAAERIYAQHSRKEQHAYTQINLAQTYIKMQDQTKAAAILDAASSTAQQENNAHIIALANYGLAQLAELQEDLTQAKQYLQQSLVYYSQLQNDSMRLEIQLALSSVLLKLNDLEGALQQRPNWTELETAADYLKTRYFDVTIALHVQQQQWQEAFQTSQALNAQQAEQLSLQHYQTLDLLQHNLIEQQQQKVIQRQQLQTRVWMIFSALLCVILGLMLFYVRTLRRKQSLDQAEQHVLPMAISWHEFARKIHRHRQETLHLQTIQLSTPQQFKFNYGEQPIRDAMQRCIAKVPQHLLAGYTVHTDALWLAWRCSPEQLVPAQQELLAHLQLLQQQLPTRPAMYIFSAPLQPLLGPHWQPTDLTGVRELIWLSWAQAQQQCSAQDFFQVSVHCNSSAPCSWSAEHVRVDILNALELGLLQLHCNNIRLAQTGTVA